MPSVRNSIKPRCDTSDGRAAHAVVMIVLVFVGCLLFDAQQPVASLRASTSAAEEVRGRKCDCRPLTRASDRFLGDWPVWSADGRGLSRFNYGLNGRMVSWSEACKTRRNSCEHRRLSWYVIPERRAMLSASPSKTTTGIEAGNVLCRMRRTPAVDGHAQGDNRHTAGARSHVSSKIGDRRRADPCASRGSSSRLSAARTGVLVDEFFLPARVWS